MALQMLCSADNLVAFGVQHFWDTCVRECRSQDFMMSSGIRCVLIKVF